MIDSTQATALRGGRVLLRPVEDGDVDLLLAILAEPEVARWFGPPDDQRDELAGPPWRFAIVASGTVVGWLACEENTDPMYRHVGIDLFLTTAVHGQGFGREAVRLAVEHHVARGHHRFIIDPAAGNERAIRAYTAVGFRPVGIMREYERGLDGTFHDGLLMDLLAAEYVPAGQASVTRGA